MARDHDTVSREGGPAFPVSIPGYGDNGWEGMTLLDHFAGQALAGILRARPGSREPEAVAKLAYQFGRAMLAERDKNST